MPASNQGQPKVNRSVSMTNNLLLLVFIIACGQMAQTIFVPALPLIASGLTVNPAKLQAVMACYLLAYGLLQFIYGPISDRIGRKKPLIFGVSLFIVGALVAANSNSFEMLILASLIQGCGTAAGGALCRSIPRDHYCGENLMKFNSYVSMAVVFLPLMAPFLGSFAAKTFGWHSVYYTLALFGFMVLMLLVFKLDESLPTNKREPKPMIASYRFVLSHKAYRGYLVSLIATFSGIAAFEAIAGILYGQSLKLSPFLVSVFFVIPIPGYLLGAMFASRQTNLSKLFNRGIAMLGAGSLFMLIPGLFGHVVGWTLLVGSTLFFCGSGMLFPAMTSAALEPFPRQAGIAGAMLGGLQNFGSGLAALVMSFVPMHGQLSIGVLSGFMVILVILALNYAKHHEGHGDSVDLSTHI